MRKTFKQALSLILTVLMIASVIIPTGAFTVSAEETGVKYTATKDWYTTDTTLYIDDASDLLAFAEALAAGKTFEGQTIELTADVDLNPGWTASTTAPTNVWADTYDKAFKGVFDGKGFTISGLYKEVTKESFGFFGAVSGSSTKVDLVEVKNLAIVNSCMNINFYYSKPNCACRPHPAQKGIQDAKDQNPFPEARQTLRFRPSCFRAT